MTAEAALNNYWNSFGIPFYEENSVNSEEVKFPYGTYQVITDSLGNKVSLSVSLWYRTTKWTEINAKTREINEHIGVGGDFVNYDDGAIWLNRGTPFAQSMGDDADDMIKRKLLNITAEYLTAI